MKLHESLMPLVFTLIIVGTVAVVMVSGHATSEEQAAQAERIRAKIVSEARLVEAQADEARASADKARVDAIAYQASAPVRAWVWQGVLVSGGLAASVLMLGSACACVLWLTKRATLIYPTASGQWPLTVQRYFGGTIIHDANRAIGPSSVYHAPSWWERGLLWLTRGRGEAPQLTEPQVWHALPASETTMLQIARTAQQMAAVVAASHAHARAYVAPMLQAMHAEAREAAPVAELVAPRAELVQRLTQSAADFPELRKK
jgi:hypothetical protein